MPGMILDYLAIQEVDSTFLCVVFSLLYFVYNSKIKSPISGYQLQTQVLPF